MNWDFGKCRTVNAEKELSRYLYLHTTYRNKCELSKFNAMQWNGSVSIWLACWCAHTHIPSVCTSCTQNAQPKWVNDITLRCSPTLSSRLVLPPLHPHQLVPLSGWVNFHIFHKIHRTKNSTKNKRRKYIEQKFNSLKAAHDDGCVRFVCAVHQQHMNENETKIKWGKHSVKQIHFLFKLFQNIGKKIRFCKQTKNEMDGGNVETCSVIE